MVFLGILGILGAIIGIAFWLGLFFTAAFVCTVIFRWVISPLAIPVTYPKLFSRDRLLLIVGFLTLMYVGLPILLMVYIIGLVRHLRAQARAEVTPPVDPEPCGIIPRFSMADMLAMVFSLGCSPAVFAVTRMYDHEHQALLFAGAVITFPACFLPMLYRLQIHNVPAGILRMLLIALAPFVAFASALLIPLALMAIFSRRPEILITFFAVCSFLILGRFLSTKARNQAREIAHYNTVNPVL